MFGWKFFFMNSTPEAHICNALRDLLPFVQFQKLEKHAWKSVTFSKVLLVTLLHGCFSRLLKLYKWYQITQSISYYF